MTSSSRNLPNENSGHSPNRIFAACRNVSKTSRTILVHQAAKSSPDMISIGSVKETIASCMPSTTLRTLSLL